MRIARFYVPGAAHHIISRLVDRRFILDLEGAREQYLRLLQRSLERSDWRCLAYALMSNHIHLLAVAGEQHPERWTKRVNSPFGIWLNKAHAGLGPIFADRPKMLIVPDADVGRVVAYIHNNPVRACVAKDASASTWTSHRAYIGLVTPPTWLDVADGLRLCGFADEQELFDGWVNESVGASDPALEGDELVREASAKAHRRGAIDVATPVLGANAHVPLIVRAGARIRPTPDAVVSVVSRIVGRDEMQVRTRTAEGRELRRLVLSVGTRLGVQTAELSAAVGVTRQHGSRLSNRATEEDLEVLLLAQRQLLSMLEGDGGDTVPRQVAGKIGRRRRER